MAVTRQSLLLRAQTGNEEAWRDLTSLYRPLITGWLAYQSVPAHEVDDLVQEILLAVVKSLPSFSHTGRRGAFRAWLRTIVRRSTCDYWTARKGLAQAGAEETLAQLTDPESTLNQRWDEEHDRYILRCLLDILEIEFEPVTITAFRRVTLDEAPPALVADELEISVGAVYAAKSRVLRRLRQEALGLIDELP